MILPPGRLPSEAIRVRDLMPDGSFGASAGEVFLSHIRASAIEAVCLRVIDSLDRETLMEVVPGPCPGDAGHGMNEAAWLYELNTAGTELPLRSRIRTTTLSSRFGSGPIDGHAVLQAERR